MYKELVEPITRISARAIGEREQLHQMRQWVEENSDRFAELLSAFDQLITTFNRIDTADLDPAEYPNFHALKQKLAETSLPTLATLQTGSSQETSQKLFQFRSTMRRINTMMVRGETTKEKPYLAFHTTPTDMEALVVGSIFHFAEDYFIDHLNLPSSVNRGDIELALEEVLSQSPESSLWKAISDKNRLNWIDGYGKFSPQFRQNLGFS